MATATLKRSIVNREISVKMPQTDIRFFQQFAKKMGWMIEDKDELLHQYIVSRPQNVDLTDEDIMEEVKSVRYAK